MPTTWIPSSSARFTTDLIQGFSPGTSPHPVKIPMRMKSPLYVGSEFRQQSSTGTDVTAEFAGTSSGWQAVFYSKSIEVLQHSGPSVTLVGEEGHMREQLPT